MNIATEKAKLIRVRDHAQEIGDVNEVERYIAVLVIANIFWLAITSRPVAQHFGVIVPVLAITWSDHITVHKAADKYYVNGLLNATVSLITQRDGDNML